MVTLSAKNCNPFSSVCFQTGQFPLGGRGSAVVNAKESYSDRCVRGFAIEVVRPTGKDRLRRVRFIIAFGYDAICQLANFSNGATVQKVRIRNYSPNGRRRKDRLGHLFGGGRD